ncbi:hypothetical protein SAMN05192539_103961 [Paraburkholderia diazotrophica]|uniref:Uncharacterized protein n=1 Tax=Paraburkholderia diazotrophica TaxID=667676 RepID=A0A1H7E2B9_9BURK|nr:hypothetical protein SAMN05192539_103961 [Paraburkholderia diazotrophica]
MRMAHGEQTTVASLASSLEFSVSFRGPVIASRTSLGLLRGQAYSEVRTSTPLKLLLKRLAAKSDAQAACEWSNTFQR